MRRILVLAVAFLLPLSAATAQSVAPSVATLRAAADLSENGPAPEMAPNVDGTERRVRNYPEQPPTIPHDIDGYQVDLNANKCLSCHARNRTGESGAPMVSVTHFMDRDGQFLATISPRRYFCNQCHVPQQRVSPMVENDFVDVDTLLAGSRQE